MLPLSITLKNIAIRLFNIIFFPILIPIYFILFVLFVDQVYFIGYSNDQKIKLLSISIVNLLLFPVITFLLLRGLGFIKNFSFKEKKERIIPFFTLSIFYFWTFYLYKNQPFIASIVIRIILGFFVLISLLPFFNFYNKVSIVLGTILSILYALIFEYIYSNADAYFSYPLLIYTLIIAGFIFSIVILRHSKNEIIWTNIMSLLTAFITNIIVKFL